MRHTSKPLCEIKGDKEVHEEEDGITITVPTTKPVTVNVTVKKSDDEPAKKEESKQGKHQLLG